MYNITTYFKLVLTYITLISKDINHTTLFSYIHIHSQLLERWYIRRISSSHRTSQQQPLGMFFCIWLRLRFYIVLGRLITHTHTHTTRPDIPQALHRTHTSRITTNTQARACRSTQHDTTTHLWQTENWLWLCCIAVRCQRAQRKHQQRRRSNYSGEEDDRPDQTRPCHQMPTHSSQSASKHK